MWIELQLLIVMSIVNNIRFDVPLKLIFYLWKLLLLLLKNDRKVFFACTKILYITL